VIIVAKCGRTEWNICGLFQGIQPGVTKDNRLQLLKA